jgi:hypothetical protein
MQVLGCGESFVKEHKSISRAISQPRRQKIIFCLIAADLFCFWYRVFRKTNSTALSTS